MDKAQAIHKFWSSFGVPAYDANTVPENAALPRITYSVSESGFGQEVSMSASVWDRSTSWASVESLKNTISGLIGMGGINIAYDNGMVWLKKGTPFAQRMSDPDESIRRIVLNVTAEFISED